MPLPSLPVLSATSCSTQAPSARRRGSATMRELVAAARAPPRPARRRAARRGSRRTATSGPQATATARTPSSSRARSTPDQRRRHHAEEAEGRVAAADVRRVHEDGAEVLVERLLLERGALVGDRHEVVPGVAAVELRRAARRSRRGSWPSRWCRRTCSRRRRASCSRSTAACTAQHGRRVGGVEHVEVEVALTHAEDLAQHLAARGSSRPCRAAPRSGSPRHAPRRRTR